MKDKKILIVIIFAGVAAFSLFFSSQPAEKKRRLPQVSDITQEVNIAKLESQVQALRGLISAFVDMNRSLKESFQEEKQQREALQQALAEAASQNASLGKELNRARLSLELTLPIKQGIDKIEGSLAALQAAPGKEKELKQKLRDINRQLRLIDAQIPGLLKENTSYKRLSETQSGLLEKQEKDMAALRSVLKEEKIQRHKGADLEKIKNGLLAANVSLDVEISKLAKELKDARVKLSQAARENERLRMSAREMKKAKIIKQDNQKLQEQLLRLQEQFTQSQKDSASLQNEYAAAQETLKRNEAAMGSRADKILVLEEKLAEVRMKLAEIQSQHNALEMESASLRKQNVAVQLEREELKVQLNQARLNLSDMENQLAQIGVILRQAQDASSKDTEQSRSVLKAPGAAETTQPEEEAGEEAERVAVELYPAETTTIVEDK